MGRQVQGATAGEVSPAPPPSPDVKPHPQAIAPGSAHGTRDGQVLVPTMASAQALKNLHGICNPLIGYEEVVVVVTG